MSPGAPRAVREHPRVRSRGVEDMSAAAPVADELDLGAVGRALLRKKFWVIGPTVLVAVLTFLAVNLMSPRYRSEALVFIEGRENVFLRPEAEKLAERERAVDQEA